MATKSILKTVNITDKKLGRAFVSALDRSRTSKSKTTKLKHSCREITGDEIKKFFD